MEALRWERLRRGTKEKEVQESSNLQACRRRPIWGAPQAGDDEEDPFKDLGLLPADAPPPGGGPVKPVPKMDDLDGYKPSDPGESGPVPESAPIPDAPQSVPPEGEALEPRRISLPLPGQVSRSSPAYRRALEKVRNDVELYKLHVNHYITIT